jgi:hypothetical protein
MLGLAFSDTVILSIAAACFLGTLLMEGLRLVMPSLYEWASDHVRIKNDIVAIRDFIMKVRDENRQRRQHRDRRNSEKMALKAQLAQLELALNAAEKEMVEVWHELGVQSVGEGQFQAAITNRRWAERSAKDFDSVPVIWRYVNRVRIFAANDVTARQMLSLEFPIEDGFVVHEMTEAGGRAIKRKSLSRS